MDIQGLGYVGVRAKSLEDWTSFGTRFLGMQLTDRSAKSLALRMDDRKQRVVVSEDGGEGVGFPCAEILQGGRVRHLPAVEADALAAVLAHHHALLAVIHPQRQALGAPIGELHAEKPGAEARPVLERFGANADISETLNVHGRPPSWLDVAGEYGLSPRAWQFRRCTHAPATKDIASAPCIGTSPAERTFRQ